MLFCVCVHVYKAAFALPSALQWYDQCITRLSAARQKLPTRWCMRAKRESNMHRRCCRRRRRRRRRCFFCLPEIIADAGTWQASGKNTRAKHRILPSSSTAYYKGTVSSVHASSSLLCRRILEQRKALAAVSVIAKEYMFTPGRAKRRNQRLLSKLLSRSSKELTTSSISDFLWCFSIHKTRSRTRSGEGRCCSADSSLTVTASHRSIFSRSLT